MTASILVHFPLHAILLLLLAALGNVVIITSFIEGTSYIQDAFLAPANNGTYGYAALFNDTNLALELETLDLSPSWGDELRILADPSNLNIGQSWFAAHLNTG